MAEYKRHNRRWTQTLGQFQVSVLDGRVGEGVVEWWGYRRDMPDVLAGCTVFCIPTVYGGCLCPKSDVNAVPARIEALVADRETCQQMGREGRRMAEGGIAVAGPVEQTLAAYVRHLPSACDTPFRLMDSR
jgi:glycosyltransferase involved in cell wall biosynthesis